MKEISEDYIQNQIVIWFNNTYCLTHHKPRSVIFSVPNGGSRDAREALKFKLTGLLPGVSDLIVIHRESVLFIEVKTDKGRQSSEQIEFQKRIEALGYKYILVRSLEEFKQAVT